MEAPIELKNVEKSQNPEHVVAVTHPTFASKLKQRVKSFLKYLYNHENKEVIGRDGLSWAKISLAYTIFYAFLGSFFIGMLAVFVATLDRQEPRYYLDKSVMSTRNTINPGMGYRPQVDVEDLLIAYSKNNSYNTPTNLQNKYQDLIISLEKFLANSYDQVQDEDKSLDCSKITDLDQLRESFKKDKTFCNFNYNDILAITPCSPGNQFGFLNTGPCIAVKLNRIYGWIPRVYEKLEQLPQEIKETLSQLDQFEQVINENIFVKCDGEYSHDKDALMNATITYYSVGSKKLNVENKLGLVPVYYYPFYNQPGYESPLVFVQFEIPHFQLINVVCRAYAANIDSADKLNMRGMVKFQLYIEK